MTAADETERMPPKETGNALTPAQIDTLRRWIEQGAPYAEHWSFVPPQRPPVPDVTSPPSALRNRHSMRKSRRASNDEQKVS